MNDTYNFKKQHICHFILTVQFFRVSRSMFPFKSLGIKEEARLIMAVMGEVISDSYIVQ